ncbi:uncharacterized protein L201_004000 [Kwoniella dendrophila CBS 6074]|uniref:Uncharacterized protein n=1 Tax=Kwoniella dendrophila CBS 6074 TaxID=1295534 RepID=A0AAX4JWT7_9TREE
MIHPEKTRSNIERLEPKITTLELPNDHGEGRVYGDYIVTLHGPQFSDDEEEEDEDEDEDQDEDPVALVNESTICSIWYRGEIKRKLMVPFKHDSRFLVIDFEKDVLIVIEPVNDLRHILHSYRFLQDPNQLIEIAQSDEEATWNTQGPPTIQILEEDGKLMLSDRYGFILYDWKTGKEQKRFPPKGFQWQGYKRWVVSPDRMLVVLDYPLVTTDPQAEAEFRKNG